MKKIFVISLLLFAMLILVFSKNNVKAVSPYDSKLLNDSGIKAFFDYDNFKNYTGLENCVRLDKTTLMLGDHWIKDFSGAQTKKINGKNYIVNRVKKYGFHFVVKDFGETLTSSTEYVYHSKGFDTSTINVIDTTAIEYEIKNSIGQSNHAGIPVWVLSLDIDTSSSYVWGNSDTVGETKGSTQIVPNNYPTGYYCMDFYRELAVCKVVSITVYEVTPKAKRNGNSVSYYFEYNMRPDQEEKLCVLYSTPKLGIVYKYSYNKNPYII